MNPIWKNMPDFSIAVFISATSASDSAGGFSQKVGFLLLRRRDHLLAVDVRRRDDDDGVDARVVDQRQRIGVRLRHVELFGDLLGQVAHRIGNRDQLRFRNAPGQIARVDAAEAAETNHSNVQIVSSLFCHHLELHHDVGRQFFAGHHLDRALDRGLAHLVRKLRHRRVHRPRLDRLLRIVQGVEADDANLAGLAGGGDGFDRAERHQIAGGKHGVDVGDAPAACSGTR